VTATVLGEVERVTFESEKTGFRVIRLGSVAGRPGSIAVVGTFPAVGPGTRVRATGSFVRDPRHGEQFRVETLVVVEPDTLVGLERYLGSGMIPGVGPGFAKRIVETFGMDALRVLDQNPERLSEVQGLGKKRQGEIVQHWQSHRQLSAVMLILQTHGASPALAARIYQRYGDRASRVVQQQPYRLALEVPGVGFKTADRIAQSIGLAGDHPERVQAGVLHMLEMHVDQGHVAAPRWELVERSGEMLAVELPHVEAAIDVLWGSERVVLEEGLVFPARLHRAEVEIAADLARLTQSATEPIAGIAAALSEFEARAKVTLAPAQRTAVETVARDRVVVVTGGPGVGKTTLVRAILALLRRARLTVRLAAPTGRAAKRLSEATGAEATTLHRLLEYDPRLRVFGRSAETPLDARALIVDEASMIDVQLAAAVLAALPSGARLVIVGDADQLPSVGPGAFLRDVIESGVVPTVRLVEIFRQAGASPIVENAHAILRGDPPVSVDAEAERAEFFIIDRRDPEQAARVVEELVTRRIPKRFGFHPRDDIQVLTPMHRGSAGTVALNALLQAALNPEGPCIERRGIRFRVGDKVMQVKNHYEKEVFNGDIGVISDVSTAERRLVVSFDGRRVVYEEPELDLLTLSYATSIHKSQGSEYPVVVIPLLTAHFVMLSRNLLYTAVTRAKRLCCLVADPKAIQIALSEIRREERVTRLQQRLRGG
jgi:exodeoxyribonuclease V alpha subunit